ncbi:Small nuclear ribonucleoprotein family protein D2 [Monocercomonoides exilis]|uniref:Small nuclear ribonucleoprotein family protein D2 n=1 Tax=Monocercomonoides exilis TaxID=2049356 RepID=UPI00355A41CB|nr:Small nuclear ribonucleoprotein family protein D2 [Monocercomonoides exilis]|eukprot:MONOS_5828.1-p1 / transcript=MONOS_5828.1 / gene=MONOS_5828 / organism=Monocercomonoides_exilis_PA203 / gene_product=Small nuclear ribonucleoprotein family protein D2 / transcript_product=Small nuclear ribonucleoprotein family protein D2 / location=Mono_scaffold00175:25192-25741(-) / protein_length=118 / sequence_SO=supercontig / SO=protein_coding / is_pseudo=false
MATSVSLKRAPTASTGVEEEEKKDDFTKGPLSLLYHSVKEHCQVLVNLRSNRKLLGVVRAFDRHMNLVMENVKEFWTEFPKKGKGAKRGLPVNRERVIMKLFVRGDSIILIVRNPKA